MNRLAVAAILLAVSSSTFAFGSRDHWTASYEQGANQYAINGVGSSQLYISCTPDQDIFIQYTDAAGRTFSTMDPSGRLFAQIDTTGLLYINDAVSPLGGVEIKVFWKHLREGQQVTINAAGMLTGKFTLKDADKVLPDLAKSHCHTGL